MNLYMPLEKAMMNKNQNEKGLKLNVNGGKLLI